MNDILNLINTISQMLIATSSIVAIVIAIRQIRNKGKANLNLSYAHKMGLYQHTNSEKLEVIAGVSIKVINLGLSPIYIEHCGLQFISKRKDLNRPGIMTEYNIIKINPGESFDGSIPHVEILLDKLDDKVSLHDESIYLCTIM